MLPSRLAWGTLDSATDGRPSAWGFLAACQQQGVVSQRFHAAAFVQQNDPVHTGSRALRYLDTWLLNPGECLRMFRQGMAGAELAFATGSWNDGSLRELSDWLDLPRIAVLDVGRHPACTLPAVDTFDGIWLQGLRTAAELAHWEANLSAHTRAPIVGWQFRGRLDCGHSRGCDSGREPELGLTGRELLDFATHHWRPTVRWEKLWKLAKRRTAMLRFSTEPTCRVPRQSRKLGPLRIAIAFDEAFSGYFPETLESLQQAGATLIDFSPLRNDCLPREIDLVYFGDGDLAPHLSRLADNHCLRHRLREFVQAGGRAIVEGRALAYFARTAASCAHGVFPMAGIFPVDTWQDPQCELQRVETTLDQASWLGPQQTRIAGYQIPEFQFTDHRESRVRTRDGVVALPCSIPWGSRRDLFRRLFQPIEADVAVVGASRPHGFN